MLWSCANEVVYEENSLCTSHSLSLSLIVSLSLAVYGIICWTSKFGAEIISGCTGCNWMKERKQKNTHTQRTILIPQMNIKSSLFFCCCCAKFGVTNCFWLAHFDFWPTCNLATSWATNQFLLHIITVCLAPHLAELRQQRSSSSSAQSRSSFTVINGRAYTERKMFAQ